ncbi:hypothetical protein LEP1GSC043_1539 [Leptospira weilii str. Ecochallenge]|uniref:Uncharacterized protein n=1 Tax=Leptospira weilii str. Ecochallenge TaxID=1049986 RepID=N1U8B4_9LEPT|nr:hypothetical protein LEP1GSC043_1539 [Leptospira weilii str. Ecochallenge]
MWDVSFTEDLSEFRQIYLRIQVLVGNVMKQSTCKARRPQALAGARNKPPGLRFFLKFSLFEAL